MKRGLSLLISLCNPNSSPFAPPHSLSRGVSFFSRSHLSTISAAMPGPETQQDIQWPAKRVRDTFVKFFEDKNHVYWKSSPVVPFNDPTLLFANAGTLYLSLILLLL
jgi:alanyl-tRNA synthetase